MNRSVTVDLSATSGRIKPVNSVNGGPLFGIDCSVDLSELYRDAGIPFVRVSRTEPYGGGRFVDVHNIFPDPELDERMELSYNFAPTDRYLSAIADAGAQIFLRLGESPDPYEVGRYIRPPRDAEKWARICERIIAHYNEGWANGFKHKIRYVEIWCGADLPSGWRGDGEDYYRFYRAVALRLKERFPRLKLGAYSSGGFYSLNHYDGTAEQKGYVRYLEGFLSYISTKATAAPLDFFSWCCNAEAPEELSLHANYARSFLQQYGFKRAESIVTEFSLRESGMPHYLDRDFPAKLASSFIIADKSSVDMMFYSSVDPRERGGIFTLSHGIHLTKYAAYEVLSAFGKLYKLGKRAEVSEDYRREIYCLAATDGAESAVLLVTRNYSGVVELNLRSHTATSYSIKGIIGGGDAGAGKVTELKDQPLTSGKITLRTGKCEVYLITLKS